MKTALLITDAPANTGWLTAALDDTVSLVPLTPPAKGGRAAFADVFATWAGLADVVAVDLAAFQESARWAVEALDAAAWPVGTAIIVRLSALQRSLFPVPPAWLAVADTDTPEQIREAVARCFALHDAEARLRAVSARASAPVAPAEAGPSVDAARLSQAQRYQTALQKILQSLSQPQDAAALTVEFVRLVRELLGVGRLALFTRPLQSEWLATAAPPADRLLAVTASAGVRREVVEHLRLPVDAGIAGYLARENKILRRAAGLAARDPRAEREFELLGGEIAAPMFDNDQLLGVLVLNGRVTGEALTNDELELVYHLLGHLARALRHWQLREQVETQQRFTSEVLANVQTGLVIADAQGRVLNLNPRAAELLELGDRAAIGQPLRELPGRFADVLFEVLQTGQAPHRVEITLPRSQRLLGLNVSRIQAAGGPVVVALIDDLTRLKREQRDAKEAADREFFSRVAYRLSHELKNSLVSIKIFGQLLPERHAEKDFREQFSNVVVNEVNRVDVLVNNLTFFAQPLGLVHEEVTLTDLLDTCARNLSQELARKKVAQLVGPGEQPPAEPGDTPVIMLKQNYAHKAPVLEADRLRLIQATEHVLRNAVQSMPTGGRLSISTAEATAADFADGNLPAGGGVRIDFQDSGEGIALEALPRVCEPFVTTRNIGVGLGLTIVKKILERHCGRLLVDSLLGRGTTVTFVLPAAMQRHPEDRLLAPVARADAADFAGGETDESEQNRLALLLETNRRRRARQSGIET